MYICHYKHKDWIEWSDGYGGTDCLDMACYGFLLNLIIFSVTLCILHEHHINHLNYIYEFRQL